MTRFFGALLACASLLVLADLSAAKPPPDKGKGPPGQEKQEKQAKHKHENKSGKSLLGEKIKHDGKHAIGKLGKHDVVAEVKKGKVSKMTAGDLPVKHVKSKEKMARLLGGQLQLASLDPLKLAQYNDYEDYYYGFCFDDGYDFICYWYEPTEVYYSDYYWEEYDPYF